ncbi:MAG: polysaccharide export protein [Candidatus Omnitrophica bacterium]|nr:polysaccharide export protein [Candidatus Omnitrophota bacterium]
MKCFLAVLSAVLMISVISPKNLFAEGEEQVETVSENQDVDVKEVVEQAKSGYTIGVDDVLEITVHKPEDLSILVTVAPDGTITFPYIGSVDVKGRSINQIQEEIQSRLADGYMRYPIVTVFLKESRSRKFFVYGEVLKPGSYPIEDNMTVLRAISTAGGFTRFGSSSRVKVLRPKKSTTGYDSVKVNIDAVMEGNPTEDISLEQGDIVVVSQGVF